MHPLTQTCFYCWLCQIIRVHLKFYDKLRMMAPNTYILLHANVNLVLEVTKLIFWHDLILASSSF